VFYVSAIPLFLSRAVFLAFVVFQSLNGPEWTLYTALSVYASALLFFFEMRLLYLLPKSLLPAICAEKGVVYRGLRKDPLYKK
jgi:hypothetical protein